MKRRAPEVSAIALLDEATHLLRAASPTAWAAYAVGALPFILGLLYFWADMSQSAGAERRCADAAFGLALLFVWMKAWQAVFMRSLREKLGGGSRRWTCGRAWRMAMNQALIQPTGLVVIPLSAMSVLPLPWVYAFYQNVSALDDGEDGAWRLIHRAWTEALRRPVQNLVALWVASPLPLLLGGSVFLAFIPIATAAAPWEVVDQIIWFYGVLAGLALVVLSPLGVLLCINITAAVYAAPMLLRSLLGVENLFNQSTGAMLNTTLGATVAALVFLMMDPVIKSVYVLRCFYGESRHTAEDLRAELRALARRAVLLVLACGALWTATPVYAQEPPAAPQAVQSVELEQSIQRVLTQREYAWRLPREAELPEIPQTGMMGRWFERMVDWSQTVRQWVNGTMERLRKWLEAHEKTAVTDGRERLSWRGSVEILAYILLAVALSIMAVLVLRVWASARGKTASATAAASQSIDIEDEGVSPEALPEDGWLAMAQDFLARGDTRLAMRALFLATLAWLAAHGRINPARYKSNRDYLRELNRRGHAEPAIATAFQEGVTLFEPIWYGNVLATETRYGQFLACHQRICAHEQPVH